MLAKMCQKTAFFCIMVSVLFGGSLVVGERLPSEEIKSYRWISNHDGSWHDPTNWFPRGVPRENDIALITTSGDYCVSLEEPTRIGQLILGTVGPDGNKLRRQQLNITKPLIIHENATVNENGVLNLQSRISGDAQLSINGAFDIYQTPMANRSEATAGDIVQLWDVDVSNGAKFVVTYTSLETMTRIEKTTNHNLGHGKTIANQQSAFDPVFGSPIATGEISIIVPSTRNVPKENAKLESVLLSPAEHNSYVEKVTQMLLQIAGGATAVNAKGYWISSALSESVVAEPTTIVSISVANEQSIEVKQYIHKIAHWILRELNQEAVFVKINHAAYLVEKPAQ